MTQIRDIHNPWRDRLRTASYRGAAFNVETGSEISGRRIVLHEYPKRDQPYAEDMGRKAIRFRIEAFLIGREYLKERDALRKALSAEGPATLQHPSMGTLRCSVEAYSCEETRERGGYCTFSISFVQTGMPGFEIANVSQGDNVVAAASTSATTDSTSTDAATAASNAQTNQDMGG